VNRDSAVAHVSLALTMWVCTFHRVQLLAELLRSLFMFSLTSRMQRISMLPIWTSRTLIAANPLMCRLSETS